MSFQPKKLCFCCKKSSEELEASKKSLKSCDACKVAQYCGRECQILDYKHGTHKMLCNMYKQTKPKEDTAELGLRLKGFDVNDRELDVEKLQNPVVDDLFNQHHLNREYVLRCVIEISRQGRERVEEWQTASHFVLKSCNITPYYCSRLHHLD